MVLNTHKDYEIKEVDGKFMLLKKKPQYPKTYEECCNVLNLPHCGLTIDVPLHYSPILICLTKLLICRDAYWRIDGDWEPNFSLNTFYASIIVENNEVVRRESKRRNTILVFPTTEMRDAFYENFKELIEQCKELL